MTPLSDALTAAQRSALATLEKAYVADEHRLVSVCCGVRCEAVPTVSGHADTIRDYLAAQPEHALGLYPVRAALDALVAENQQLRDALTEIEDSRDSFGTVELYAHHAHRVAYNALAATPSEATE